jgi:hypothetical protein
MFLDDSRAASAHTERSAVSHREIEFADALNRYIAGVIAEHQRRLGQPTRVKHPHLSTAAGSLRRLRDWIIEAMKRLGDAMSGNGRFQPPGIM